MPFHGEMKVNRSDFYALHYMYTIEIWSQEGQRIC